MRAQSSTPYTRWGKRAVDIVVGTPVALLAIPLLVVLGLGALLSLRAWPIFVQRRTGYHGRAFRLPKLRTLPTAAPDAVDKYSLDGVHVRWFGRVLRKYHLDELPQLLLVPFGRMSLVGPRPEMVELRDRYPESFREARERVRPGCTGLWQISDALPGMIYEAPEFDERYVEHMSLGLDLWILGRTILGAAHARPVTLIEVDARLGVTGELAILDPVREADCA